jgi:hypothetical protein
MTWWMWAIVAMGIISLELALLVAMCRAAAESDRREVALVRARSRSSRDVRGLR